MQDAKGELSGGARCSAFSFHCCTRDTIAGPLPGTGRGHAIVTGSAQLLYSWCARPRSDILLPVIEGFRQASTCEDGSSEIIAFSAGSGTSKREPAKTFEPAGEGPELHRECSPRWPIRPASVGCPIKGNDLGSPQRGWTQGICFVLGGSQRLLDFAMDRSSQSASRYSGRRWRVD